MATSSVPALKGKLLELLSAAMTVQVAWGHPGKNIALESVFMADVELEEAAAAMAVHLPRKENYMLPVWVSVLDRGNVGDGQQAEERMWELVGEVEDVIRASTEETKVGGVTRCLIEAKYPRTFIEAGARVAECMVALRVEARI